MERFVALFDLHFGYERKGGHKVPLHDSRALGAALAFIQDFKPDHLILGGDMLDCGVVSHHNHGKPGATEGLKLIGDAKECKAAVIQPLEVMLPKKATKTYIIGNHEDWLTDLTDKIPALEGIVDLNTLLGLDRWKVIPQGGSHKLGKLTFVHGDTVKGGENVAKAAVTNYERSIRFGHHHTFQTFTKTSPYDDKIGKTGIAVPCLCGKNPRYMEGKPNRWVQGFNFGYLNDNGTYTDYIAIIVDGKFTYNGLVYRG